MSEQDLAQYIAKLRKEKAQAEIDRDSVLEELKSAREAITKLTAENLKLNEANDSLTTKLKVIADKLTELNKENYELISNNTKLQEANDKREKRRNPHPTTEPTTPPVIYIEDEPISATELKNEFYIDEDPYKKDESSEYQHTSDEQTKQSSKLKIKEKKEALKKKFVKYAAISAGTLILFFETITSIHGISIIKDDFDRITSHVEVDDTLTSTGDRYIPQEQVESLINSCRSIGMTDEEIKVAMSLKYGIYPKELDANVLEMWYSIKENAFEGRGR